MRRNHIILLGIIFSATVAKGQETLRLSLKDCTDYALKHNYSVKNAAIDVLIQKAQNDETLSATYPHINGKVDINNFYVPQRSFVDASAFNPNLSKGDIMAISFTVPYAAAGTITASQLIFDGSVFIALKARNSVMELARRNADVTSETVRYNVYKAYNSLVIAYRQYDIIKSSLGYARSLEHDLEVTRANGFAEKIDVDRTTVQVNNLAADSVRIANMLTLTEQVLKFQMGMDLNTNIILTDTDLEGRAQSATSLMNEEKNYDRLPEYQALNSALKLNQYNLRRYRLAAVPTLSGYWAYGSNIGSNEFNTLSSFSKYWANSTLGLQMNIPIFNGMMRLTQVREAKLNIEKSKNNIENMKQVIDFQIATSRTSLKNAIIQVQSQKRNMELANDVLELAQKKYKAGVGSNLEVTQAQTDQLRAQTNYFSALLDMINAEADLKKSLGLLK